MTDSPANHVPPPADAPPAEAEHPVRPADAPPSVDVEAAPTPSDEAERQAQDTIRSISRLEESN